jgi:hypothetical protein
MKTRIGTLAVLTAALACSPAYASPAKVKVRVEGATKTIFEGSVRTDGHNLSKDSTGSHPCDGTNGGAFATPGPTITGALDDASKKGGFDWAATWSEDFQDFFIGTIGPDTQTSSDFWGYAVNGVISGSGGCQARVGDEDEVLFYYGGTFKNILRANGPKTVRAGRRFHVKVLAVETSFDSNGKATSTVKPIAGARIGGKKTNAKGVATLKYRSAGVRRLKASKSGSVRSNQVRVKVKRRSS